MADSDNTRVCPSVTRRVLLTGTVAAATATWTLQDGVLIAGARAGNPKFDPALKLWHEWKTAYLDTANLCRKQQDLETRLVNAIGFPQAEVHLLDEYVTMPITCHAIEKFFCDRSVTEMRAQVEADLAAHQARWDAEDRRIGYSAAKREELAAADQKQDKLDALMATPAATLAGVAAKLDAILREGESSEDCKEFPWPQLRATIVDLVRIGQQMQPGVFLPGSDRKEPIHARSGKALHFGDDVPA